MPDYTSHRSVRQRLIVEFEDGVTGTTTGAGSTTTLVDTSRVEKNDYWVGGEARMDGGANENLSRLITASLSSGTITHAAFGSGTGSGNAYELVRRFGFNQYDEAIREAVRRAMGIHWIPWMWDGLVPVANTYDYLIPQRHSAGTITIDAGSTANYIVDAALTQAADYWNGGRLVGLTGGNAGLTFNVSDFDAVNDRVYAAEGFLIVPSTGDTFHLMRFLPQYIAWVEYIPSGGTIPIVIPSRDFDIVWRGAPYIRFEQRSVPPVKSTVRVYGYRYPEAPTHDQHPVEMPDKAAMELARYQLLRSKTRRPELKLDADDYMKREAYELGMLELSNARIQRPSYAKKVTS